MPHEGTFQLQTDPPSIAALLLQYLFQSWQKTLKLYIWYLTETRGYDQRIVGQPSSPFFKVWFLQNSKISTPNNRKSWLDLSKYSPVVGVFLSWGPWFCRKILPRGRAFDYLKKIPRWFGRRDVGTWNWLMHYCSPVSRSRYIFFTAPTMMPTGVLLFILQKTL